MVNETGQGAAAGQRRISLFGATGSIGASTIDVLQAAPEAFDVEVVSADRNAGELAAIARRLGAKLAVVADEGALGQLREALAGSGIEAAAGRPALVEAASRPVDLTVAAIVGAAGLAPTMAAIEAGSDIALANKECLVSAGSLFVRAVAEHGVRLLPVDSEHNAIFQAMNPEHGDAVERIVLTASGGPFRNWTIEQLAAATPDQAVSHPNWDMGKKVSVDSSTLMNKGLEVIEAHHLFDLLSDRIDVLVHPQSIVHGLVEYRDGSVLAQLSRPDMRVPIANCLWWPIRRPLSHEPLNLAALGGLSFEAPDLQRFPALGLARQALESGSVATNILNAANEVAVEAFLNGRLGYLDIVGVVETVLAEAEGLGLPDEPNDLEATFAIDAEGRRLAQSEVTRRAGAERRVEVS